MWRVRGCQYWKAKDYFNGLDVGLYLVEDGETGSTLKRFAGGDFMRFWALLPAATRERQQQRLKERIQGNEYGWIEEYEDAEMELRTTILAGLELTLNPPKMLRRFASPPPRLDDKFEDYLKLIQEGKLVPQSDYGFWVWAAAKFYRESGSNAWLFWMKLDMNYTGQFSHLGLDYQDGNVMGLTGKALAALLQRLDLFDIGRMCRVSKGWRRAIWMCFFDCPPVAYQRSGKTIKPIWC